MKLVKKVKRIGSSLWILLPDAQKEHLGGIDDEDEIYMEDGKGKHGNFLAIWKKEKDTK